MEMLLGSSSSNKAQIAVRRGTFKEYYMIIGLVIITGMNTKTVRRMQTGTKT